MNRKNLQLARSLFVLGGGAMINYAITFFLTPFITENIGIEAYGFVSIAKTFVSYAQVFTIALTSFVVRYMFTSYHNHDMDNANAYYNSSIAGCLALSGTLCAVLLLIDSKLEWFIHIPNNLMMDVKILFAIMFVNFVIYTMITPFSAFAHIANRMDISGFIQIAAYFFNAIVLCILFLFAKPVVWYVGVGAVASSVVMLLGSMLMTKKMTPELIVRKNFVQLAKIKEILSHGIWNSFNALGNVLNSGLDLLISNLLLTDTVTGQVSVAKSLGLIVQGAYGIISQPFQPMLLKAYTEGSKKKLMQEMAKAIKICGCFANIVVAGFIALGKVYFQLWMPSQDHNALYWLTVVTLFNGLTMSMIQPVYYVYTMTVKNKIPCIVTILSGLLNVVSMFVLLSCTSLGGYAVVGTTTCIMMTLNMTFNVLYAAHCLNVSPGSMYYSLCISLLSGAVMIAVFKVITLVYLPAGWLELLAEACVMGGIGFLLHFGIHRISEMIYNPLSEY